MSKKQEENEDDLHRINVGLTTEEYERFKILARDESRSMTNFATLLIRRYIRDAWNNRITNNKPPTELP